MRKAAVQHDRPAVRSSGVGAVGTTLAHRGFNSCGAPVDIPVADHPTSNEADSSSPGVDASLSVSLQLNGQPYRAEIEPWVTLLDLLRERADLTGVKKGCDHGQCGACTVLVDGQRINSCLKLAASVDGCSVTTIEGLGREGRLDPLQQAFMRVPTGWGVVWDRPVRYVYEVATTRYLGSETELGLQQMSSVGFGLELDSSAYDVWATRWRLVGRYKFGPGMHGAAVGLAISF